MRAREPRLGRVHAAFQPQLADDLRHHRLVAVGADAHLDLVGEVDAVDEFEKAVHEMLARHLAVGDDVDAGILLLLQREQRRVGLGGGKLVAGSRHCGQSLFGSASQDGFGRLPAMVVSNIVASQ